MTQQFRKISSEKSSIVLLITLSVLITGCAIPTEFNLLSVEISHEAQDRFLEDIPRDATNPPRGTQRVQHSTILSLEQIEETGFKVSSWIIKDFFGNKINEVYESPNELKILVNHKIVANIECATDDACISGYTCVNGKCNYIE